MLGFLWCVFLAVTVVLGYVRLVVFCFFVEIDWVSLLLLVFDLIEVELLLWDHFFVQ